MSAVNGFCVGGLQILKILKGFNFYLLFICLIIEYVPKWTDFPT